MLLMLLTRLLGPARRLVGAVRISRAAFAERSGALSARIAALRGELARRRRSRNGKPPSEAPAA